MRVYEVKEKSTKMMDSKWVYFQFLRPVQHLKDIQSSCSSFAKMILNAE